MLARISAIAILAFAVCTLSIDAQGKKGQPPAGSIEIVKNKDGEYRYRIKNAEGKTIAMPLPSMSWEKKADVLKAINDLKVILQTATPIEIKDAEEKTEKKVIEKKPKA